MGELGSSSTTVPQPVAAGSIGLDRPAPSAAHPAAGTSPRPGPRLLVLRSLLATATVAAVASWVLAPDSLVCTIAFLLCALVCACVAFAGARSGAPALRRARSWIALGLALSWLGDATWQGLDWVGPTADVTIADVPWLACYAALGAGLLGLLGGRDGERRRIDIDALIDMAMAAVVGVLVLWETAIPALLEDTSVSVGVRSVWAAYPVLDLVVVVLLVRTLTSRRSRASAGAWLVTGMTLWLAADFAFLATGGGPQERWMDLGWLLGASFLAAATLRVDTPVVEAAAIDVADEERPVSAGRLLLGTAVLLVPPVVMMVGPHEDGVAHSPPSAVPMVAAAVLVLLAWGRGMRLIQTATRSQQRAQASDHYFRSLALNSSDAVLVVDASGEVVQDLHNLGSLAGTLRLPAGSAEQIRLEDVAVPVDPAEFRAVFEKALVEPGLVAGSALAFTHIDGSERWVAARMVNLLHDPHVEGVVIHLHDITDHRQAQLDLERLALHDALTGLANRTLLGERIEHALLRNQRTGSIPAVLFLDLDGFKTVNDSLGHDVGDLVLIEVARRLEGAVRAGDTVSRLGGDEFAVLIEQNHPGTDQAATTAERVQQAFSAPFAIGPGGLTISASIGIAVAHEGATAAGLLRDADVAMYRAKAAGRARSVLFETAMGTEVLDRIELEADLTTALELDQFEIVYQPVVELQTEELVGFEALLRWNHPQRGLVMPDAFIPITEDTGSIIAIGQWVLETACMEVANWRNDIDTGSELTLAVNLSACQLACPDIVSQVVAALDRSGLPAASLVLEMTETALVKDACEVAARLQQLRDLGVRVAVDDFGTGYSSLSYLRQFPIDILKIDRSFIDTITDRSDLPAIVRGLLDLGRTLGLDVVAEGVELGLQRDWLRSEQCRFAQGYLFARPLTVSDARDRILEQQDGRVPVPASAQPVRTS